MHRSIFKSVNRNGDGERKRQTIDLRKRIAKLTQLLCCRRRWIRTFYSELRNGSNQLCICQRALSLFHVISAERRSIGWNDVGAFGYSGGITKESKSRKKLTESAAGGRISTTNAREDSIWIQSFNAQRPVFSKSPKVCSHIGWSRSDSTTFVFFTIKTLSQWLPSRLLITYS